jgi:hypothetical protein
MLGLKVFKFEYLSNTKLSENCRFGFQHQQVQCCYQVLKFHDKVCEVALWHREGIVKHIFIFSNNIYHIFLQIKLYLYCSQNVKYCLT